MHLGIVDDDTRLIENLRFLLQSEPGVQAVHTFASAEEFLAADPRPELDILLVDMDLPGLTGVELIARITAQPVTFSCLAYTVSAERDTVFAAIQAGACGYVLKGGGLRELVSALYDLKTGGAPMSPGIARQVLRQFQQRPLATQPAPATEDLSEREQAVLRGLARGEAYKEIASAMSISTHTVNSHVKKIYQKLHVCSRGEAVRTGHQHGWL
jgi:DNA-binding NarL/FixJ family response regulator